MRDIVKMDNACVVKRMSINKEIIFKEVKR